MTAANARCSQCDSVVYVTNTGQGAGGRRRHCQSPTCDWCEACWKAMRVRCGMEAAP